MGHCRICGAPLLTPEAEQRGCCDVPDMSSQEEQVSFWLEHEPDKACRNCPPGSCERATGQPEVTSPATW